MHPVQVIGLKAIFRKTHIENKQAFEHKNNIRYFYKYQSNSILLKSEPVRHRQIIFLANMESDLMQILLLKVACVGCGYGT